MKKLSMVVLPALFFMGLISVMSSFKSSDAPVKATCQFSPVSGDFANVEFENCNNIKTAESVAAGSSFTTSLLTAGCQWFNLVTSLPPVHPAGTIRVYINGTLHISHPVAANEPASFYDSGLIKGGDKVLVTW